MFEKICKLWKNSFYLIRTKKCKMIVNKAFLYINSQLLFITFLYDLISVLCNIICCVENVCTYYIVHNIYCKIYCLFVLSKSKNMKK